MMETHIHASPGWKTIIRIDTNEKVLRRGHEDDGRDATELRVLQSRPRGKRVSAGCYLYTLSADPGQYGGGENRHLGQSGESFENDPTDVRQRAYPSLGSISLYRT